VKLPKGFGFADAVVSIRKAGNAVILEPLKTDIWPSGFFEEIHVTDPALARPPQGETPPVPGYRCRFTFGESRAGSHNCACPICAASNTSRPTNEKTGINTASIGISPAKK